MKNCALKASGEMGRWW